MSEKILNKLEINRLTKTQLDNAQSIEKDSIYLTDPQFSGGKILKTDSEGNIVESDITPSDIPGVVDNLTSTSTTDALSAKQGKELKAEIDQLKALGRYLSNLNCATGALASNPPGYNVGDTYTFKSGDYIIVDSVAASGNTNYKPSGLSYIVGSAFTTVETEEVHPGDMYIFDSAQWLLLHTEVAEPINWIFYND